MKRQWAFLAGLALLPATLAAQPTPATPRNANGNLAGARPALVEGRPVETRSPEKKDNQPSFPEQTRAPYHATAPFKVTTLIDNLTAPWSLAFLPSGKILVTERLPGKMRLLDTTGALSAPLTGVSVVSSPGAADIGLLDVALDPAFATNQRIFFTFYDFIDGTNSNTNVARARLDETTGALSDVTVIFRAQPPMPSRRLGGKTGGRIAIGRDGNLILPIGDRSDSPPWDVAQRMDTHLGKIIRITPDGAPPPDNPFIGKPGVLPEIWATGTRSQEGLAFDPRSGRLWETEHGPRGGDELNIIEKGKNYGWPVVSYGKNYNEVPIPSHDTRPEFTKPVLYWVPVIAPGNLMFYRGAKTFPQWDGSGFVSGMASMALVRIVFDGKGGAKTAERWDIRKRIRDIEQAPDGSLWMLEDANPGALIHVTPK